MAEIINTVKVSLPGEPASTRCIFLAGYLAGSQKLPGGLVVFDKAADAFMAATGVDHDAWELFLEVLVARTMATADDMTRFRSYIGAEAAAFLQQTAAPPVAAAVPSAPQAITVPLLKQDVDLFNTWLAQRGPLSAFPLDKPLIQWAIGSLEPKVTLMAMFVNAQGGPVLFVRASTVVDGRETWLVDSVPARNLADLHKLLVNGAAIEVTFKAAA